MEKEVWNMGRKYYNILLTKDEDGDYALCDDDYEDGFFREVAIEHLKSLADAIYAELGLGWLPYPENKPEKDGEYLIAWKMNNGEIFQEAAEYSVGLESWFIESIIEDLIIAFYNPTPYHP